MPKAKPPKPACETEVIAGITVDVTGRKWRRDDKGLMPVIHRDGSPYHLNLAQRVSCDCAPTLTQQFWDVADRNPLRTSKNVLRVLLVDAVLSFVDRAKVDEMQRLLKALQRKPKPRDRRSGLFSKADLDWLEGFGIRPTKG